MITGKKIYLQVAGRDITVFNQRSRLWTHPYDYVTPMKETLSNAGCGIFSVCHCGQWMTGKEFIPEELADFSMANGGRGDDGTDRPALLAAMQKEGLAARYGFAYHGDGLRNDLEALGEHLIRHEGTALCNLRVGHIVALLDASRVGDEVQVLALDSYSESSDSRVADHVREIIPESAIVTQVKNCQALPVGEHKQYALYWVNISTVRDFNLLHAINE